ncbi:amidohydrolase family protein [Gracilimonas mengyeensis]|uniref:Predicted metal-dependent hydrolase, TIM-barrel fold n=1 Tax=Gracilimonas mengyeensis TaxID=1302730 RepID=A0A521BTF7_9BACT|nr:amidohydrolase family protein [Gracilimonas mengyeensis]SMO50454.1 Predicted metal-dependent hydrolase, TIM-barrel fold [Gracilimonas mengyeensis]
MIRTVIFTCVLALMGSTLMAQDVEEEILLKNYRPVSIYKLPEYKADKAKFTAIDMHSHNYPQTEEGIAEWVETMKANNIRKTILLTYATGAEYDSLHALYSSYGDYFEVWCGIDYTGYEEPGFAEKAVKELERLHEVGATGIGELGDKGSGLFYSHPTKAFGMHIDDERLDPVLKRAGELNMPVNIHVAEPYWFYMDMDSTNDGMMNALNWRLDNKEDILGHGAMLKTLENAVAKHPNTTFVAAHLGNSSYDLAIMDRMLEKYPNLYADVSARYAELSQIPRHVQKFITKHQDKIVYGTDMGTAEGMYNTTFRVLQTMDEHFYEHDSFGYHWSLNGFDLSDEVLRKVYQTNPEKILNAK